MQPTNKNKINKLPSLALPPIDIRDGETEDEEEEGTVEQQQQPIQPQPFSECKEFCSFEFPSGLKIITGSSLYTVYHLANLNFSILDEIEKRNKKPKEDNKTYFG